MTKIKYWIMLLIAIGICFLLKFSHNNIILFIIASVAVGMGFFAIKGLIQKSINK